MSTPPVSPIKRHGNAVVTSAPVTPVALPPIASAATTPSSFLGSLPPSSESSFSSISHAGSSLPSIGSVSSLGSSISSAGSSAPSFASAASVVGAESAPHTPRQYHLSNSQLGSPPSVRALPNSPASAVNISQWGRAGLGDNPSNVSIGLAQQQLGIGTSNGKPNELAKVIKFGGRRYKKSHKKHGKKNHKKHRKTRRKVHFDRI